MGLLPSYGFFCRSGGSLWEETSKCADLFRFSLSVVWEGNAPMGRGRIVVFCFSWRSAIFWSSGMCSYVGMPRLLELVITLVFFIWLLCLPWLFPTKVFRYDASCSVIFPKLSAPDSTYMWVLLAWLAYITSCSFLMVAGLLEFCRFPCIFTGRPMMRP